MVYGLVDIGRFFSCGRNCEIGVVAHPIDGLSTHGFMVNDAWFPKVENYGSIPNRPTSRLSVGKVTKIGNDVWVGAQSIIVAGVTIGDGAIIGANSTVTKDVKPYEIVGGSPARTIRFRFDEKIRQELADLKWWEMPFEKISQVDAFDISKAIEQLRGLKADTVQDDETAWHTRRM